MKQTILENLATIEQTHNVRILFAVESGNCPAMQLISISWVNCSGICTRKFSVGETAFSAIFRGKFFFSEYNAIRILSSADSLAHW